jgi:hypothetical protein
MRKTFIFLLPLLLTAAGAAQAGDVFLVTMNTSSISGDAGSLDFSLSSGAGSDQSLSATVSAFTGGSYGGTQATDGDVSGGPVTSGSPVTIGPVPDASGLNDDFETFNYGTTLSFLVSLSGPGLTAPDGNATSPYEFDFFTYSDGAGTVPVLTSDPNGISGLVDVSPEGMITVTAVSPNVTITAPAPDPGTVWLLASALGLLLIARSVRQHLIEQA